MKVIKLKNKYKVESQSDPEKFYYVDLRKGTCTCPEFVFRMRKIGGICKHISAAEEYGSRHPSVLTKEEVELRKEHEQRLREHDSEVIQKERKYDEILSLVEKEGDVSALELYEKYGELVDDMKRLGELVEVEGKIRILE